MSLPPLVNLPQLAPNVIVPTDEDLFIPFLNQLYEDIAYCVNSKDDTFFTIPISSTAANIPNLANFGAFIICVSGTASTQPTITASLCKADSGSAGSIATLGSQVGTDSWAGFALTISSTATNFQIRHNNTGINASFNIRIIGTQ